MNDEVQGGRDCDSSSDTAESTNDDETNLVADEARNK